MGSFPSFFAPLPKLALGAAVALAALSLSPGAAHAACASGTPAGTCRVTVGGLQYDVTTFTGSYNSSPSNFAPPPAPGVMPWWGSSSTANAFATAVGLGLGPVNFGADGPAFAYGLTGGNVDLWVQFGSGQVFNASVSPGGSFVWAQATLYSPPAASVPGPLPIFGAAAAFGFSRKLRKRLQESRVPAGSGQTLA